MKNWKDIVLESVKNSGKFAITFMGKNDLMFPLFRGTLEECWYEALNYFQGFPKDLDGDTINSIASLKKSSRKHTMKNGQPVPHPSNSIGLAGVDKKGKNIILFIEMVVKLRNKKWDEESLMKNREQFNKKNFGSLNSLNPDWL